MWIGTQPSVLRQGMSEVTRAGTESAFIPLEEDEEEEEEGLVLTSNKST